MKKYAMAFLVLCVLLQSAGAEQAGAEMISVHERAVLVAGGQQAYPARLTLADETQDEQELLTALLGEGAVQAEEGLWREDKAGEVWEIRTVRREADGTLRYSDPWVAGERGAEYEPPKLERTRGEALELCRTLLSGLLPEESFAQESGWVEMLERWNGEEDFLLTDEQYDAFCREMRTMRFQFPPMAGGLPVLDAGVSATVGVNGVASLTVDPRSFVPAQETAELMPLEEAVALACTTRSAPAVLLYAAPVYSNRVSGSDEYNLSWYLVTNRGSYVVDCVLDRHVCDSWEY
ncbi:MAG: hypothetical protein Q4A66_03370 [Eubacteriales bacterium]|nr:hypothetical protein [Eubacteriales bacterium]